MNGFNKKNMAILLVLAMLVSLLPTLALATESSQTNWKDAAGVSGKAFVEAPTEGVSSYSFFNASTAAWIPITIDRTQPLGSMYNPIGISSEEELILFGQQAGTATFFPADPAGPESDAAPKFYLLDKPGGVYDMRGSEEYYFTPFFPSVAGSGCGMPEILDDDNNVVTCFSGVLVGNGAVIKDARIGDYSAAGTVYSGGLFSAVNGYVTGLTMENCTLYASSDVSASGQNAAGMLAGVVQGGIFDCHVINPQFNDVERYANLIGGLAGGCTGMIVNSSVTGTEALSFSPQSGREGTFQIGGLCGTAGKLLNCAAHIQVSLTADGSSGNVGGLAGEADAIVNSAHVGAVNASANAALSVGGLAGEAGEYGIANSYHSGTVSASGQGTSLAGGLSGSLGRYAVCQNSYWNGPVQAVGSLPAGDTVVTGCGTIGSDKSALTPGTTANCGGISDQALACGADLLTALNTGRTQMNDIAELNPSGTDTNAPLLLGFTLPWYAGGGANDGYPVLTPEARWGVAGTDNAAPASWIGSGTLTDAVTYANGLTGGTAYIQLLSDVKIASMLEFSSGKTTVLDLKGFDIDRGSTTESGSSVLDVRGSLTLRDTSANAATAPGKITGGRFVHVGGVNVSKDGILVMEGGSITGNTAYGSGGGGVCVDGSFTMTGGSITGNSCENGSGGGVYVSSGGSLTLGGAAEITGNTRITGDTSATDNIYLATGLTITISSALTNKTPIGVNMQTPGVFTAGNTVTNSDYLTNFTSDSANFAVRAASGNQLELAALYAITKTAATNGTFTVNSGGSEVTKAAAGDTVTVTPAAESGYALDKITVTNTDDPTTTVSVTTNTFTMPEYPVSVTVNFTQDVPSSPPPSSSPGGSVPVTPTITVPVSSDAGKSNVSASVSGGTASVSVTDSQLKAIVSDSADTGTVKVDVSGLKNVSAASVPAKLVDAAAKASGGTGLAVSVPNGSVALDSTALGTVNTGKSVVVSVDQVVRDKLSDAQKASVPAGAPIVDVNVLVGGTKVHDFNGGRITVSVPYTLKEGENPDSVTVWYLEDDGSLTPMSGKYDSASGMVVFTTTHLSQYVIGSFPFTDVPDSAYYEAVVWAAWNRVASGTSATTFSPDGTCTRAEAVTFLWRAMGSPEPAAGVSPFADVETDTYYYKAVLWAAEQGFTLGTSATTFSPDDTVTRAEAMTLLYRAAGKPASGTENPFTDADAGNWYGSAVLWAVAQKITVGTSPTTFSPADPCTRAQIVTFLYRYFGK